MVIDGGHLALKSQRIAELERENEALREAMRTALQIATVTLLNGLPREEQWQRVLREALR